MNILPEMRVSKPKKQRSFFNRVPKPPKDSSERLFTAKEVNIILKHKLWEVKKNFYEVVKEALK